MYSVVTWEIDAGPGDPALIRAEADTALAPRTTCDLYDDVRITHVASEADYLRLHEDLQDVADAHPGQFRYAVWALRARSPMRTNVSFDHACAREVIDGD